jgi:hypothetical protein
MVRLLCINKTFDAKIVFDKYMELQKADSQFTETPLTNFIKFLLLAIDKNNRELFEMLKSKYAPAINRDRSFNKV